jgi:hypothetical protein
LSADTATTPVRDRVFLPVTFAAPTGGW